MSRSVLSLIEVAGGQIHDLTSLDGRIETEVEIFQTFEIPESGLLDSSGNGSIIPDRQFVVNDQFQKLLMVKLITNSFLQTNLKGGSQS